MAPITEKRVTDERGYIVFLSSADVEFAHYAFTKKGFARGGGSLPYDKDVTVCLGELLYVGLPPGSPQVVEKHSAGEKFFIPADTPTLVIALSDALNFTYHRGTGQHTVYKPYMNTLELLNKKEINLENLLKEFGVV
jgi:hypothetical protein